MKVQAARAGLASAHGKGAAPRLAHTSGAGGHEAQAQRAARGFVDGHDGLARGLTPAPAGAWVLPASVGEPLPGALRMRLEHAFDADFLAVRVHRDRPAQRATASLHALAFASGSELYFSAGAYAPQAPAGQALIAHELAHVLQQSGVRAAGGGMRLAAWAGVAAHVQCQPGQTPEGATDEAAEFETLVARTISSAEGTRAGPAIEMARAALAPAPAARGRIRTGSEAVPVDYGAALVRASRSADFDALDPVGKGFIVDCLKRMGYFARARQILQADTRFEIRIGTWSPAFVAFLVGPEQQFDWTGAALGHSDFHSLWPDALMPSLRGFILRPHSPVPPLPQRLVQAHAEATRRYETALRAHRLIPQETVVLAWMLLDLIGHRHQRDLEWLRQRYSEQSAQSTPMHRRVDMLTSLRSDTQSMLDADDTQPHMRQYASAVLQVVDEVLPFWQACLHEIESLHAGMDSLTTAQLIAPVSAGGSTPVSMPAVTALHDALLPTLRNLFAIVDDVELPDADTYQETLNAVETALSQQATGPARKTILEQLDDALAAEFERTRRAPTRRGARAVAPDRARLRALMSVLFWTDLLRAQLMRYDHDADVRTPHFADERGGHRIQTARWAAEMARWMHWNDILAVCEPVLSADWFDTTQLWLISDWEPDPAGDIARLGQDFPSNLDMPFEGTPFSARQLMNWFRLDYNRRLAATLEEILRAEDHLPADGDLHLERLDQLRHTRAAVAESTGDPERQYAEAGGNLDARGMGMGLSEPQRFSVREWEASFAPEGTVDWSSTLELHPKTRLQLVRHLDTPAGIAGAAERAEIARRGARGFQRMIFPRQSDRGVFAWVLPSLVPMIRALAGWPAPRDATLAGETAWLRAVDPYNMTADKWDTFSERMRRLIETPLRELEERLPDRLRRLSTLRRRVLTPQLRERMRSYLGGTALESGRERAERFATPQFVVDRMDELLRNLRPSDEADLQMGLLMLSLAPQILGFAERPLDAAYFNQFAYSHILATVAILDDSGRFDAMRRCCRGAEDEAGNIVYIPSRLAQARAQLQQAKTAMERAVQAQQQEVGYRGSVTEGSHGSITPLRGGFPILAHEEASQEHSWRLHMRADEHAHIDPDTGISYQILRVHRDFTYFHAIGSPTPAGMREGAGGAHAAASIVVDGERPASGEPLLLFTMLIDGVTRPVTENDVDLLARLNDIFLWRSFGIGMESLAALNEAAMQWIITVAAVAEPHLAYVELATTLARTADEDGFTELVSQLYQDPLALIGDIGTRLGTELLRADHLWRFLLLNNDMNPLGVLASMRPSRTRRRTHPPTTRLGRIVAALRDIGQRLASSVQTIKRNTAGPLRSAQANISLRPRLAWMLLRAADFVSNLGDQVSPTTRERIINGVVELATGEVVQDEPDAGVFAGLVDAVSAEVADSGERMERSTRQLLEGLARFELPAELVNLELATELIVQFILDGFGSRGRAYRLVMELFPIPQEDSAGDGRFAGMQSLYQWVCAQVAAAWRSAEFDPNRYWHANFQPIVRDRFDAARDELVGRLYDASDFVLDALHRARFPRPTGLPSTEIDPVPLDPAVQGGPVGAVRRSSAWRLPRSAGLPLPDDVRRDFEARFGVRFRHVRMHDGEEGRAATEPIGARAVTSGSHIYRHPDLAQSGALARRLLAHELAHVVQQLGPAANRPAFGRAGAGLVLDVAAERAADIAADRVVQGAPAGRLGPSGVSGAQPSFDDETLRDILHLLATPGATAVFTDAPGGRAVPGIAQATTLWTAVRNRMAQIGDVGFASFMPEQEERMGIGSLLREEAHVTQVNNHLPGIAQLAQRQLPRARRSARVSTELDPVRFASLLEGYLFGAFGVAMQIDIDRTSHTFRGLTVTNVDLGRVAIDHVLWDRAMRAFSDPDGAIRRELHQRFQVLQSSGEPQPGLFERHMFKFSSDFVQDYRSLERSRGSNVETQLPTARDYCTTRSSYATGLALETHGNLKARGVGTHKRESHHMSQYLLAQFFSNTHARKIFPTQLLPAVRAAAGADIGGSGNTVESIATGGRRLRVTGMDVTSAERGRNMPAILLAARTHKRGRLHIERAAQWNADLTEETGTESQGNAISNVFNTALPRELRTSENSAEQRMSIQAWYAAPGNVGKGGRPYYDAAVATYHWMYRRMIPALEQALLTEELAYYLGTAARRDEDRGSSYRASASHMRAVFAEAKRFHDQTMQGRFGWPTPSL